MTPRRRTGLRLSVALLVVVSLIAIYVASSMMWPATVPRIVLLPKPPDRTWDVDCNEAGEFWEQHGIFWSRGEFSTVVGCGTNR